VIRIRLSAPRGVGPVKPGQEFAEGFSLNLTMPAVPRVDETIALGGAYGYGDDGAEPYTYRVHGVHWYPDPSTDFDVYIVLR
jgi:hypothetical protein